MAQATIPNLKKKWRVKWKTFFQNAEQGIGVKNFCQRNLGGQSSTLRLGFYFAIFAILAILWARGGSSSEAHRDLPLPSDSRELSADTVIPPGYVLVPIDIQNEAALNGIIGGYGVVDLFASGPQNRNSTSSPVARRVKIMRAPLNPRQFAVLVSETQSSLIARYNSPFIVVIQNPKTQGTFIETKRPHKNRTILEENI